MEEVIGHEQILKHFQQLIERKALARAYFFTGLLSVGKTTLIRYLGQQLLCEKKTGDDTCASCVAFAKDQHPDFFLFDPETQEKKESISIDTIRELERRAQLKPAWGAHQVIALAHADRLHPAASNAFLKIVEEPPEGTIFFLSAETPHRLPATLRSRMQRFYCHPVSAEVIAKYMTKRGETPDRSQALAQMTLGCPGIAIRAQSETGEEERYRETINTWVRLLKNPFDVFQWTRDGEKEKSDLHAFLAIGHLLLHDLFRARFGMNARILSPDAMNTLASTYAEKNIARMSATMQRARALLQTNVSPVLLLENLFLSFTPLEVSPALAPLEILFLTGRGAPEGA